MFARELNIADFKALIGWLDRWTTSYLVNAFKVSGESASVDSETINDS